MLAENKDEKERSEMDAELAAPARPRERQNRAAMLTRLGGEVKVARKEETP